MKSALSRLKAFWLTTAVVLLCIGYDVAWGQSTAGRFVSVIGDVRVVGSDGVQRSVQRGGEVREGDTILTGANGVAQIRLTDGGSLSLRTRTEMKLDGFRFAGKEDTSASLLISLAYGGFRSVTGLIGKLNRSGYRITTPTAAIGIRGTDHETVVVLASSPGARTDVPAGTYDRVYSGTTFIENTQGVSQDVNTNQVGFVSAIGAPPVLLPTMPSIYRTPTPAPRSSLDGSSVETAGRSDSSGPDATPITAAAPVSLPPLPVTHNVPTGSPNANPMSQNPGGSAPQANNPRPAGTNPVGAVTGGVVGATNSVLTPVTNTVAPVLNEVLTPVTTNVVAPLTNNVVAPVANSVVAPVTNVVAPVVTNVVAPVVAPVTNLVAPVVAPVTNVVAPVVAPVTNLVAPVVAPVINPAPTSQPAQQQLPVVSPLLRSILR
jgi:FecR protein